MFSIVPWQNCTTKLFTQNKYDWESILFLLKRLMAAAEIEPAAAMSCHTFHFSLVPGQQPALNLYGTCQREVWLWEEAGVYCTSSPASIHWISSRGTLPPPSNRSKPSAVSIRFSRSWTVT